MENAETPSFGFTTKISLLEQVRLQAQVLVPVIRAFRTELGAEQANRIVGKALREWAQQLYRDIGSRLPGTAREKFNFMNQAAAEMIGKDVDIQPLKQSDEAFEFNVTGCRYADFFRQLGEPELGALLLCDMDIHQVEQVTAPDVELTRTQTIMKGAGYCDFRYKMKSAK